MKITLLYGPAEAAKREQLLKIKNQYNLDARVLIDLKRQNWDEVLLSLRSRSLFETEKRLVIVENVPKSLDLNNLNLSDQNCEVILVTANLEAASLLLKSAQAKKIQIIKFDETMETSVFPFLDNLIEGKSQAFVELEKLLTEYSSIYILTMIYYLLRRNILPQSSPFMQKKVKSQLARINDSDLELFYKWSLETEFKIKSGLMEEKNGLFTLSQKITDRVAA